MGVSRKVSLLLGVVGLSVLLEFPTAHAETSYHRRPFRTDGHKCAHNELANKVNPWDDRECIPVCDWGSGFNTLIGKCEKCECGSAWGAFSRGGRILNEEIEGINGYGTSYSAYGQHSYDKGAEAAEPDCSCICGPSATFIAGEGCVRWDVGREKYGTHRGFSGYSDGRGDRSPFGRGHKKGKHGHKGRRTHYDNKWNDKPKHNYGVEGRWGGNDWGKSEDYSNWSSDDYPVNPRHGRRHSSPLWNYRPEKSHNDYGRQNRWGDEDENRVGHSFDYRGKRGKHDVDRKSRGYGKHFGRWDGTDSKDEKWSESDSWSQDAHDRRPTLRRGRRGQSKGSWEESKESWDHSKDSRRGRRRRNARKDPKSWAESNDFSALRKGDRNDRWQSKNGGQRLENGKNSGPQIDRESRNKDGKWGDDNDDDNKWGHDDDDDGKNKPRRGRRGDGKSKDDDDDDEKWGKDDDDRRGRGRKGRSGRGSGDDDDKWNVDDDKWGRGRKGRFDRGSGDDDDKWNDSDDKWGRGRKGRFARGSGDDDDKWNDNDDKNKGWKDRRTRDRLNGESQDNSDEKWGNGDDGQRGDRKRRGRDRGSRDNDDEKWGNGVVKGIRPGPDNEGGSWDKGSKPGRPTRRIPNLKDNDDKWNGEIQSPDFPVNSREENNQISKDNEWGKVVVKNTVTPST